MVPAKPARTLSEMQADAANRDSGGKGIRCPKCGCGQTRVFKTTNPIGERDRRRECRHCGTRMTTVETIV